MNSPSGDEVAVLVDGNIPFPFSDFFQGCSLQQVALDEGEGLPWIRTIIVLDVLVKKPSCLERGLLREQILIPSILLVGTDVSAQLLTGGRRTQG
jgi:hypothetical protein